MRGLSTRGRIIFRQYNCGTSAVGCCKISTGVINVQRPAINMESSTNTSSLELTWAAPWALIDATKLSIGPQRCFSDAAPADWSG